MPSSTPYHLPDLIDYLCTLHPPPKTILDVGIGTGKIGMLIRDFVGTRQREVFPEDWKIELYGIEAYAPYKEFGWLEHIYDGVRWVTAQVAMKMEKQIGASYDIVLCLDCLEHIPKEEGIDVLNWMIQASERGLVIAMPCGSDFVLDNRMVDSNLYDKHQARWEVDEVLDYLKPWGQVEHAHHRGKLGGVDMFTLRKR